MWRNGIHDLYSEKPENLKIKKNDWIILPFEVNCIPRCVINYSMECEEQISLSYVKLNLECRLLMHLTFLINEAVSTHIQYVYLALKLDIVVSELWKHFFAMLMETSSSM